MQYADLMRPDEDWRGLGDPSERRKIQNRIAQRAYRRNMRERANKIEELKEQLRTYEEFHLQTAQDDDGVYAQKRDPPSTLPPNKRGVEGWCPPQQVTPPEVPSKERFHTTFPSESQFSRVQQQSYPAPVEQQTANSPRPGSRQRMDWAPSSSQRTVTEAPTPGPTHPMEGGTKSDGIMPLSSADLSTTGYEDFDFDLAELVNKGQQSTSLLHMAVAGNHIDTIKVLLQDERVMIDDKDSDGFTPLQRAVMHGRSEIVKLLLEHSANTGPVRGGDLTLRAVSGFGTNYSAS
ncbi:hypothetical protein G7046_g479 [Stylonectria norvegica]|nr:hypothetical protein G7046_g479 [Stylonectria norvegica]